jgi:hypothetical protein
MNELQYIREKFKNKDFIEITHKTHLKIFDWLVGDVKDGQTDVRKIVEKISEKGFIKFLNEGVILIKPTSIDENIRFYYFVFRDDGMLQLSIYINNPESTNVSSIELLCKIECGLDTRYTVMDGTYNEDLAKKHISAEFEAQRIGVSTLMPIIKIINEEFPKLKPDSPEWRLEVSKEYFRSIIKSQIISILGINAYLSLLQKEILISRIEQVRELKASDKGGKRSKRNPFYRYVVELPPNYRPRKFDLNYVASYWERSGHRATRWVLPENAELLAKRKGGTVTNRTKGKFVAIEIPIAPQTCHRKVVTLPEQIGNKTYLE